MTTEAYDKERDELFANIEENPTRIVLVTEDMSAGNAPIGLGRLSIMPAVPKLISFGLIYGERKHRGHRLAIAMGTRAIDMARREGCTRMFATAVSWQSQKLFREHFQFQGDGEDLHLNL